MNNIILVLVSLLLFSPIFSYAQEELTMRSMAADQLYQYGQAIYDRGNYDEAARVFSKVLAMDSRHEGALGYAKELKKKGKTIEIPASIKPIQDAQTDVNANLKQDIRQVDKNIERLKEEVADLHTQIVEGQKDLPNNNEKNLANKDKSK
ncbi:MAG: hypothetical protein WCH62_01520 [Candidatus Omnitrophota bacterium]